jgi:hypothetical protein
MSNPLPIVKIAHTDILNEKFLNVSDLDDDPEITKHFKKTVADLKKKASKIDVHGKRIAPKANGFLYFTCIMMHAAEASCFDDDGNIRKSSNGDELTFGWDKRADGSWVWQCSDPNIRPYKNSNADIFPEEELKKAYKKWVGKPLCLDHKSQSVDMIRGIVVDTVYDEKKKRIIALCALDKENHPELARKVASGYAASVSMGTAVGKAICTEAGCHRVARVESDFCEHMRAKSCYGEINVELSPIELSIVVNGADPKAKIRRVISAADRVAKYEDRKKLDEAGITVDAAIEEAHQVKQQLEKEINDLQEEASDNQSLNTEGFDPYASRNQGPEMDEISGEPRSAGYTPQALDTARLAENMSDNLNKLREKIGELDNFINKMASVKEVADLPRKNRHEDTVMANTKNAYFQGGGGVNEPTPGQVKYQKEDSDSIRNNQDKQMVGAPPFEGVGGADGMYPGDEQKKRELQRLAAEAEQRGLRRQAAMDKAKELIQKKREAYFQGGGGVNEPTPGKVKYPNETDYTKIRDNEDKQMVGAPPFPGVGSTTGLYGTDEADKKKLLRAHRLGARFVKASNEDGSDNLADSQWHIYAKDNSGKAKLILSASVAELAGEDRVKKLYAGIATKDYGLKMIDVIKSEGLDNAKAIFKGAQTAAPAAPGAAPAAPVDAAPPAEAPTAVEPPMGEEPMGEEPMAEGDFEPAGETGSPIDQIQDKIRELGNLHADLEKAVEALEDEEGGLGAEELEGPEAGLEGPEAGLEGPDAGGGMGVPAGQPVTASVSVKAVKTTLANGMRKGMKQAQAELEDMMDELKLIQRVNGDGLDASANKMVAELLKDAKPEIDQAKKNAYKMMASFVRYAKGVENLKKTAQVTADESKQDTIEFEQDTIVAKPPPPQPQPVNPGQSGKPTDKPAPAQSLPTSGKEQTEEAVGSAEDANDVDSDNIEGMEELLSAMKEVKEKEKQMERAASKGIANMTREERDAMRVKLAQKGVQFSDMLQKAHPGGGFTTDLDVKPEGDLAKVETLPETKDKHMDVATAAPRNVREAAEKIQKLVVAGTIDPKSDFPALIAEGLDPAAVSYWKSLWGNVDPDASKWVGELVKEHQSKKTAAAEENTKVKVARAYELAYAMAERGLCPNNPGSLRQQADKILSYSEENFAHLQETLNRIPVKTASVPEVGVQDSVVTATQFVQPPLRAEGESLVDEFAMAFNGRKY